MHDDKQHRYSARVTWTGNLGQGTSSYRAYSRNHEIAAAGKPVLPARPIRRFAAIPRATTPRNSSSSRCPRVTCSGICICAREAKISVIEYVDEASGAMAETARWGGRFTEVTLRPQVVIAPGGDLARAEELHEGAHHLCFIANSVNFPVRCEPRTRVADVISHSSSDVG
jgi:organic hydroperoxide reductase OsmC/OhrA